MFIQVTLKNHKVCRVYGDLLQLCWDLPELEQAEAIVAFAEKYGWEVKIHEPGDYGRVADFVQRQDHQSDVQQDATDVLVEWGSEPAVRRARA